jgi:glycosyltransferase involved in cell wall biosynthesis
MTSDLSGILELKIITRNRARDLEATLAQLKTSPIAHCELTIFDNCSTDDTPEVCARYAREFTNCSIRRNKVNVGLCANYLRAVESAEKEYTWVLCDDDDLDFTHFDEVAAALRTGNYDLISIGAANHTELPRGVAVRPRELLRDQRNNYLYTHSFIPCALFRTRSYSAEAIRAGYNSVHTLFAHLHFLFDTIRRDALIYITRHNFITFRQENVGYRPLHLVIGWLQLANQVAEPEIARAMCHEMLGGAFYPRKIAQYSLLQRGFIHHKGVVRDARRLAVEAFRAGPLWFLKVLPFVAVMHLPAFVSKMLWRVGDALVRLKEGRHIRRPTRIEFADGENY